MNLPNRASPLLALPRELREEIISYLVLPAYVYTSSTVANTANFSRARTAEKTYIDTRISLPFRLPANVLATCQQLRHECLEHHAHRLNSSCPVTPGDPVGNPTSWVLAERLGNEFLEESERACDDGTIRITLEIQRALRGPMGYAVPTRNELSPRFLALLSLMKHVRRLKIILWPGYDWWSGGPQPLTDKLGRLHLNADQTPKFNAASTAIGKVLDQFIHVEDLNIDILMQASELGRWDLPDQKWEPILPWLNGPVTNEGSHSLRKVSRTLYGLWNTSEPEPFFTQVEVRKELSTIWDVTRKGDVATVSRMAVIISYRVVAHFHSQL